MPTTNDPHFQPILHKGLNRKEKRILRSLSRKNNLTREKQALLESLLHASSK